MPAGPGKMRRPSASRSGPQTKQVGNGLVLRMPAGEGLRRPHSDGQRRRLGNIDRRASGMGLGDCDVAVQQTDRTILLAPPGHRHVQRRRLRQAHAGARPDRGGQDAARIAAVGRCRRAVEPRRDGDLVDQRSLRERRSPRRHGHTAFVLVPLWARRVRSPKRRRPRRPRSRRAHPLGDRAEDSCALSAPAGSRPAINSFGLIVSPHERRLARETLRDRGQFGPGVAVRSLDDRIDARGHLRSTLRASVDTGVPCASCRADGRPAASRRALSWSGPSATGTPTETRVGVGASTPRLAFLHRSPPLLHARSCPQERRPTVGQLTGAHLIEPDDSAANVIGTDTSGSTPRRSGRASSAGFGSRSPLESARTTVNVSRNRTVGPELPRNAVKALVSARGLSSTNTERDRRSGAPLQAGRTESDARRRTYVPTPK